MDQLIRGPLLWFSLLFFIAGMAYRTVALFRFTRRREVRYCPAESQKELAVSRWSPEERKLDRIARFQNSILGKHPVMTLVSTLFHVCLITVPVFLLAHGLVLRGAIGLRPPALPDGLADVMTVVVLACGVFFLARRIAVPKVAAISSFDDFGVLALTLLPFLTGFLASRHLLDYPILLNAHILSGEALLLLAPFTKVGHMVFFFFSRLLLPGEYGLSRGARSWQT
jgi:nitrate reductase gamma subunit